MDDYEAEIIPFTAVVITYNESRHLRSCLESLQFCDQLVVFDLGSSDGSVELAKSMGAEVIPHPRVLEAAPVRAKSPKYAQHNWMIFVDPDEIFPVAIVPDIRHMIAVHEDVALITLPRQNYFKGTPLTSTSWGRIEPKGRIINRERVVFSPYVHHPFATPIDGYITLSLPHLTQYCITHYWIDSYYQLFEKHWRYAILEGESKYARGERFSPVTWCTAPVRALKQELLDHRGLQGGWRGIFLSLFRAGYVSLSQTSLLIYQIGKRSHVKEHLQS